MGIPKKSKNMAKDGGFDHFTSKNWDFDQENCDLTSKNMVIGPKWWFDQRKIVLWTNQDSKTWIYLTHFSL